MVAIRLEPVVLRSTQKLTSTSPALLPDDSLIQVAGVETDHGQSLGAPTFTEPLPPLARKVALAELRE